MSEMTVVEYTPNRREEWDNFVDNMAINGTFLQSRRFLEYHKDRFVDASLMFYRKGRLVCVCPACFIFEDVHKIFWSHKGSTFGGLVITKSEYISACVLELIAELKRYLICNRYSKAYLKITPDIFALENSDLLEYALVHEGFAYYTELSTYIDYNGYDTDIASNFSYNHRRKKSKHDKLGTKFRALEDNYEIKLFYDLLTENLARHGAVPVHSFDELIELYKERLPFETEFFGVFLNDIMIAGAMMFYFTSANTSHTQYLCSKYVDGVVSPTSFLYYNIIKTMREKGFRRMSWGISTEEQGHVLNNGLTYFKESVGSKHSVNRTYYIDLEKEV